MLNVVSLLIGNVALIFVAVAFLPLLGWMNWLVLPLAIVGAGIGLVSSRRAGQNLNLFVIAVGVVRLILGFGIV